MVHLSDPDLPDSLDQLVYDLLEGTGITITVTGPCDLSAIVEQLRSVAPFFAESDALMNGLAAHPTHQSMWAGVDGDVGAAVFAFIHPGDSKFIVNELLPQLQALESRFRLTTTVQGDIDDYSATFLQGAAAIPLGTII